MQDYVYYIAFFIDEALLFVMVSYVVYKTKLDKIYEH